VTRQAVAERPATPPALAGLAVYAGMPVGTHLLDDRLAVRDTRGDFDEQDAWRLVTPCVPAECFHPVHGFGKPHGRQHLTWLHPDETQPTPLRAEPVR
jgi:hypothetical protein